MIKKENKIIKTIYYAFIAFIGATAILLIISTFPITGNFKVKNVLTGSMEPAISVGSIIVTKPADEYKIGDIITFQFLGEIPITHRIYNIGIDEEGISYFITKGDANEEPDERLVRKEEIIGRVLFDIPFIGYFVGFTQTRLGFILIIVIPSTIIIYEEFRKIGKEIIRLKSENDKKDKEQDKKIEENEQKDQEQDKEIEKLKQEIDKGKNYR